MDTRSKILTAPAALEITARPIAIFTGTFDVLRAGHVRALEAAHAPEGGALLVVVLPRAGELLPQCARAELVASLRMVDYVVAGSPVELDALIDGLDPIDVVSLEEAEERLWLELRERVLARCRV